MRFHGSRQIPAAPVTPDTIYSKRMTAASAEAADFPTGADLVRITFASSDGGNVAFVNFGTTKASVPTTAYSQSTEGSSACNVVVSAGNSVTYQIPGGTTGFSFVSPSSGYLCLEFWGRGGSTST